MAPKKQSTATATRRSARLASRSPSAEPPEQPSQETSRRSARIASRSPSVEPQDDVPKRVRKEKAPLQKTPAPTTIVPERVGPQGPERQERTPLLTAAKFSALLKQHMADEAAKRAPPASLRRPEPRQPMVINRKLKMLEIERVVRQLDEKRDAKQNISATPPSPPHSPAAPQELTHSPNTSSEQQRPAAAAPSSASPPPPSTAERAAGWLKSFTSFFHKRPAEESPELPPSAKRSRVEEPVTLTTSQSVPTPQVTTLHSAQTPRNYLRQPQFNGTPYTDTTQDSSDQPQSTPRRILTPKSPRDYGVPSTKNPRVPTSLSTITEYTEPSMVSNFADSLMGDTPSRPPRDLPQSTPRQVPQSTPARRQPTTPSMRRSAQLRAARSAGNTTPSLGLTAKTATPKPREPNADARLAKVQLRDSLKRQLEILNDDDDIKEMDSHRVKRVKIDNLVEIPHNKPGDPDGCFRFPEEDSDDEMEVYENVEERSNLFEETIIDVQDTTMHEEQQTIGTPVAAATDTVDTVDTFDTSMFSFPDVGPVPEGYYVSEEFKEEAGRLFSAGFAEWVMA